MPISYHELTALWRRVGGEFHGPHIETGTMPEADLLPFLQALAGDTPLSIIEQRVNEKLRMRHIERNRE